MTPPEVAQEFNCMPKDIILFINAVRPATFAALKAYEDQTGRKLTPVVFVDEKINEHISERNLQKQHAHKVKKIVADFDSVTSVRKALAPIKDRIFAVTSQYENSILELKKIAPYFPVLPMPSESSLEWSTEKKLMREHIEASNPKLVPRYKEVSDNKTTTINSLEETMSYPMIVKPSGLEGSLLVTRVENRHQLQRTLGRTFREMQKAYDKWIKRQDPIILVEEFMEGDMYSVDNYIDKDGICHHTPIVKVVTGRKAGYDDFFGYMQTTPSDLDEKEITKAYAAADQACHAVGLRSSTAHVELMKTATGWKIVELGPRIGGFRHDIYMQSYGINHIVNDILNRAGEAPIIPAEQKTSTAFFNIYARAEGVLEAINGLEAVKQLPSFVSASQNIQIGEPAMFAKNNGDPILVVNLSHKDDSQFRKDVEAMEATLQLVTAAFGLPEAYRTMLMGGQVA